MDFLRNVLAHWRSPLGVFMLAAGAAGVYYLLTEHLTHVGQAIPYLILLACPLMHAMGHGRHGGHGGHGGHHPGAEGSPGRDEPSR